MFNQKNHKSAFTLIELVIVMLLMALISGMVISYSVFIKNYIDSSSSLNDSLSEISTVRSLVEGWFSYYDDADYTLSMSQSEQGGDTYVLSASDNLDPSAEAYTIDVKLVGGEVCLCLEYPDGESKTASYALSYVTLISFSGTTSADIYRCEVTSSSGTLRFLLTRHTEVT